MNPARRRHAARRRQIQITAPFGAVETSTMDRVPGAWRAGRRLAFIFGSAALVWAAIAVAINALG